MVKQHGGLVLVDSELGKGTTFRVFLPVTPEAGQRADSLSEKTAVQGGSETILIVEDHDGLRELASETLTNLGYNVLLATDGEEALDLFRNNTGEIDLALLDVMLPKLNGIDVYTGMVSYMPELPVIFATGYTTGGALAQKLEASGCPILSKPYSRGELARKIREMLERSRSTVSAKQSS